MIQKKVLIVVAGVFFGCLGMSTEASAVAYGGAENFVVSEKDNKKAIAIVEENGGLDDSPIPIENLTTESPAGSEIYNNTDIGDLTTNLITPFASKSPKVYSFQSILNSELYCRYLVPVGFNWSDNGISVSTRVVTFRGGSNFTINPNGVSDTLVGGYGTGGYYWRLFKTEFYSNGWKTKNVWLSAWDFHHLYYG